MSGKQQACELIRNVELMMEHERGGQEHAISARTYSIE